MHAYIHAYIHTGDTSVSLLGVGVGIVGGAHEASPAQPSTGSWATTPDTYVIGLGLGLGVIL